jgi:hypothetical protein
LTAHAAVGALFLAANYFYTSLHCENRQKEVARWEEKNVDLIAEKQSAFDTLMHDRAARNQAKMGGKMMILKAFFGSKIQI